MARALTLMCAAVPALGLSGCDPDFCDAEVPDPVAALFVGLLCSGRDPGPSTPPTASFTVEPSTVPNGGTVRLDASASSDAESKIVRYEWDVDAFPFDFEVDAGSEPVIERQVFLLGLAGPEERIIRLRVTEEGVALARFPRGRGKACLRIAMATRDRGRPAGRVTVLGGTRKAARLRGGGRFTFAFEGDTPRLNGRLQARLGKARPLPRACAGL